ncbi:hypothetical protein R1flu_021476 [Riccia fluitans]|uniref:Glycerophosphocholine acyltransferase 1 n=1 Tax=Riccia fluitans TaxID=41844 RepID=A0ABD1ZPF9_9MARC
MAPRSGDRVWPDAVDHFVFRGQNGSRSPPKVVLQTKEMLTKHAEKLAKRADEHEQFLNKVTYSLGVVSFGTFCFLLGSRPQDIPYLYCLFFITVAPLRWIYYRIKKWHYYLLDFCYYANAIFMGMLLFYPNNDKLFLVCFSFSEGPLAWALIVWRCSLVFSSIDKIISVLIHLLPGTVFFIIRWWDPVTFSPHTQDETGPWPAWPFVASDRTLWTWLFVVPLVCYSVWQMLYFLVVNVMRRQRMLRDPEIMTSYRELSRKAARANNIWWRVSGILGDNNRVIMYAVLQAVFTVATMALTVPMFKSYRLHISFEIFKLTAAVWNGGNYLFEVMPRHIETKKKRKATRTNAEGEASGEDIRSEAFNDEIDNMDAKRRHLSSLTKSTSFGDVPTADDVPICAICKKSSSLDASQLGSIIKGLEEDVSSPTFAVSGELSNLRKRAGFVNSDPMQNGCEHLEETSMS